MLRQITHLDGVPSKGAGASYSIPGGEQAVTTRVRRARCWIIATACAGALSLSAALQAPAQEQAPAWQTKYGARIVAEFESGVRVEDAAELWSLLSPLWRSKGVAVQPVTPSADDKSLCHLVERHMKLQPGACTEATSRGLLEFSASHGGSGEFKPDVELRLPLVEVETYRAYRHFDLKSKGQRDEAQALFRDPVFLANTRQEYIATKGEYKQLDTAPSAPGASRNLPTTGVYVVESVGVRWIVPIVGELTRDDLAEYEAQVGKLSTKSRLLAVERAKRLQLVPGQKFAGIPRALVTNCTEPTATSPPLSYANLVITDKMHNKQELEAARACATGAAPPRVIIIDEPIKPHPDIAHALGKPVAQPAPAEGPLCGSLDPNYSDSHHGTYLAGIIASKGIYNPYRGINPDVVIRHVPNTGNNLVELRSKLQAEYNAGLQVKNPPQIVLYASTFGTSDGTDDGTVSPRTLSQRFKRHRGKWLDELRDGETRLSFPAGAKHIVDNRNQYLFVVAAGQDNSGDDWPSPIALRSVSNMSPQNFGSRGNVLVVTACTACDAAEGDAALWIRAYYSSNGEQIVQLAAPGGDFLPGLIDEKHLGGPPSGGTSAAAAIVAGVASRMLGCYPESYLGHPNLPKERLLTTAPEPPAGGRRKGSGRRGGPGAGDDRSGEDLAQARGEPAAAAGEGAPVVQHDVGHV